MRPEVVLAAGAASAAVALMVTAPVRRLAPPAARADPPRPGPAVPPACTSPGLGRRLLAALGAAVCAALLLGGITGLALGVAGGVATWVLVGRVEPREQRTRRERLEAALPHVVDLMACALSAGAAPDAAVRRISEAVEEPVRGELAALTARLRWSSDPVAVWRGLSGHPQLGPLGRAVVRAVDTGASVAEALHRLAEDLRAERAARAQERARAVGARAAAPLGLCLLPAFVLVGVVPLVAGAVRMFTAP